MSEHCGFCFTVPCRCDTYLVSEPEIAEWQESRGEYLNKYDARRLMATAQSLRAQLASAVEAKEKAERVAYENLMLAHGWMHAHDSLKDGNPYEFPAPTDIPKCVRENQRQAVEIEELRRLLAATVSTVSRRTDAMIEAYNAVPVEGDDETPAAMKEKL